MNRVSIIGRLTRENDVKYSTGENAMAIVRNTVAVNRKFKNKEGKYDADFIGITAFGKTGEFINNYFHKGDMIAISGRWTTGSYEKDGVRVYTNELTVEEVDFCGSKSENGTNPTSKPDDGFMNVDGDIDELPFS